LRARELRGYCSGCALTPRKPVRIIFAPLADRLLAPGPAPDELRRAPETAGV
jgi:hypothetical protein